ncbi:MAG TPA: hypothetical protein PLA68_01620, partial [Panacibacter sp.]|nr:hypothetical protein [Panacibacter sp.]
DELGGGEKNYPCPVPDFGISKIELSAAQMHTGKASSLEIIVVMEGEMQVKGSTTLLLKKGEAAAILPGETYLISTMQTLLAYKAFVP